MRTRTALGRRWRAEAVAPVATIAKVLRVSRQSLYDTPVRPDGPRPPKKRSTPPPLPEGWQQLTLSPGPAEVVAWVDRVAGELVGPVRWGVSRLDLFSDWQGWTLTGDDRRRFVCRATERKTYEQSGSTRRSVVDGL